MPLNGIREATRMGESEIQNARAVIAAAISVAASVKARSIMAHSTAIPDWAEFVQGIDASTELIIIHPAGAAPPLRPGGVMHLLEVPEFNLTRMDQIKMATMLAFSHRLLDAGQTFVALSGPAGQPIDTLVVMRVGKEYELFLSVDQPKLTEHVRRVVFQRVLTIALELATEGREGRPIGTTFVIGSVRELQKHVEQTIMNPFRGYGEKERNILDESMRNTVKEFAAIDGAFIIKGNGVIVSAGTTLRPEAAGDGLPPGLGARHAAAAAITASTHCIAITVSQSTGAVRLWRRGRMITEIEQAPRGPH
jgi:DNA integrity scanning protein DisA with diadenylate cyclase activity